MWPFMSILTTDLLSWKLPLVTARNGSIPATGCMGRLSARNYCFQP
jgi:hypothetical protein